MPSDHDDSVTSAATRLALAGTVASALLVALGGLTADLVVALLAVLALAATSFAALWAAVAAGGRTGPRRLRATSAGVLGASTFVALSASPRALLVPVVALLAAAAAHGSLRLLGAAPLLGLAGLVVVL